ncbi:MAG: TadE/TadG family type IV pilus assembly protein [Candidatus Dormibacteraceae bacterium]
MRGTALVEFALAWPIALLLTLGCVEVAVWSAEAFAARSAALAGARGGSVASAPADIAEMIAIRALNSSLVGTSAATWCPGQPGPSPDVWVCARDLGTAVEVAIGGAAPALVPLVGGRGLPIHADAVVQKEKFS